jgi:hypothetical protein
MNNTTAITRAIEAELAAAHVTKNQLADQLGIARSNLLRRFNGEVPWNVNEVEIAANCTGLSLWELMSRAEMRANTTKKAKEKAPADTDAQST